MYLHGVGNYTQYLIDLIDKDRLQQRDPKVIDSKIKEHKQAIEELQNLKKAKAVDQDQINELLAYHAPAFKKNAMARTENQRIRFIERAILPDLKKLGSKQSAHEIDEILLNWPDQDVQ